jgi:hypothetical protein
MYSVYVFVLLYTTVCLIDFENKFDIIESEFYRLFGFVNFNVTSSYNSRQILPRHVCSYLQISNGRLRRFFIVQENALSRTCDFSKIYYIKLEFFTLSSKLT